MLRLLNRQQIPVAIQNLEEFSGSNRTIWAFNSFDDTGWTYEVKSYGVVIGRMRTDEIKDEDGNVVSYKKTLWINPERYSVTTSAHTGLVRKAFGTPPKWSGTYEVTIPR